MEKGNEMNEEAAIIDGFSRLRFLYRAAGRKMSDARLPQEDNFNRPI